MAMPTKGNWARTRAVPYSGTNRWGTGINPVHSVYGAGPPLRVTGRNESSHTAPGEGVPDAITGPALWGYTAEDATGAYLDYDGRPPLGEDDTARQDTGDHPPWNASGWQKSRFRMLMQGAHRYAQQLQLTLPSETVSEGWLNKPHGMISDAKPSDPSQYEMQTSMRQRYRTRNNDLAVGRSTDAPRSGIESRIAGMKLKVYSGGERHYDMFPRQQDDIPRPFYYRTAGTGVAAEMAPNAMFVQEPIQRVPPPDPSLGDSELDVSGDYGYTPEDTYYA